MAKAIEADAAVVPLAQQRRRHQRTDLCFKVRFCVLHDEEALRALDIIQNAKAPLKLCAAPDESYMENVSAGGLGICGQLEALGAHSIREGDFLKLEVQPLRATTSVRCLGRVAWVEISRDAGLYRAGVSFVAVNPQDLENLQPAVA